MTFGSAHWCSTTELKETCEYFMYTAVYVFEVGRLFFNGDKLWVTLTYGQPEILHGTDL